MRVQICDENGWPVWFRPIGIMQSYLRLISRYYPNIPSVFANGVFGADTEAAVTAFQQEFGLPVTGNIDLATWELIAQVWRGLEKLTVDKSGLNLAVPRGDMVLLTLGDHDNNLINVLQTILKDLAENYGNLPPVAVTGVYDDQTSLAVQAFQRLSGLTVAEEGWLDRPTWNRLLAFWGNRLAG